MFSEVYCKTGIVHRAMGIECQDYYFRIADKDRHTIVVCDGIQSLGGIAAKYLSKLLAKELHTADYLESSVRTIKAKMYILITESLTKLATENGYPKDELATTVMAISVDCYTNRVILLHLGDGLIINPKVNYPLSLPENRMDRYHTAHTMCQNMYKSLRVHRTTLPAEESILLVTDGVSIDNIATVKDLADFHRMHIIDNRDDATIAIVTNRT